MTDKNIWLIKQNIVYYVSILSASYDKLYFSTRWPTYWCKAVLWYYLMIYFLTVTTVVSLSNPNAVLFVTFAGGWFCQFIQGSSSCVVNFYLFFIFFYV